MTGGVVRGNTVVSGCQVMLDEALQQVVELAALPCRQWLEQCALRLVDEIVERAQGPGARRRDADRVAATVAAVRAAEGEPVALEIVEDRDDVAAVDAEPARERGLADRPEFFECGKDCVVIPTDTRGREVIDDQPVRAPCEPAQHPR